MVVLNDRLSHYLVGLLGCIILQIGFEAHFIKTYVSRYTPFASVKWVVIYRTRDLFLTLD